MGVIAYELSNFFLPFDLDDIKDKDKFIKKVNIASRKRKWLNSDISADLMNFIDSLLRLDPESRLGVSDWN
jgi:serine/threonine protein kinase